MNDWPPTLARQQRRENTSRSHLATGCPGQDQGTHKLPATRILERLKRDGRLLSRGPTDFPGSSSVVSISAEWCMSPRKDANSEWLARDKPESNPMTINPETVSFPPFPSGKSSFSPVSLTLLHPGKDELWLLLWLLAVPHPRPSSHTSVLAGEQPAPQGALGMPSHTPTSSIGLAPAARSDTWNTSRSTPQRQSKLFIRWSVYNSAIKLNLQKGKMAWLWMALIFYRTRDNWLQWKLFSSWKQ